MYMPNGSWYAYTVLGSITVIDMTRYRIVPVETNLVTQTVDGCAWPGHCAGAFCSTYNDCSHELVCSNGHCGPSIGGATGGSTGGSSGGGSTSCSWPGHCAGASCGSHYDCSDDLICVNGQCGY
ncbi:hypothetical protein BC832DRAFT_159981 [Gaertneriomyces semiglobifer]|nr:hypothetical protein BC832DRAFT_159981 [Gaertneriomyces semiglobifer]